MLDDLKYIHEKDAQDALGIAASQPEQLVYDFDVKIWIPKTPFTNIVYAGMGGSSLAANISHTWPGYVIPFEIVRNYHIPKYVSKDTLFIACSYSGNTEETLSALAEAEKTKATIVIIAGGGKLQDIAKEKGYKFILLPKASQPRYAVFYNLKALLQLLRHANVFADDVDEQQLKKISVFLENQIKHLLPTTLTSNNPAKQLAREIAGKSLVIYAGPSMAPAAYKWKISCNENAKNIAWCGLLPEFSHNEFIGWSSHPHNKPYAVADLRSSLDHPQIQKRFTISARLLSGKRPEPLVVEAIGSTLAEQLLWMVIMGDFTTLYLGLLNGLNPTPVELVERLKKELA
ncbi:bifunctional phosphoglucose/phosphomannose isomerase [Candidatus Saccharibacteria bacterium]|nr:bifunctional phosphoglucose/phosphomannose isomerase [Candidatus Saccharibacteria bacterium]